LLSDAVKGVTRRIRAAPAVDPTVALPEARARAVEETAARRVVGPPRAVEETAGGRAGGPPRAVEETAARRAVAALQEAKEAVVRLRR
jgi:hypothetical protein